MPTDDDILSDDILEGLVAIGKFIGKNERQTQYLVERGYIPTFRYPGGKIIHARKSELRASHSAKAPEADAA